MKDLRLNKNLPREFIRAIRDDGYNYDLLRLGDAGYATTPALWVPVPKDMTPQERKFFKYGLDIYEKRTSRRWERRIDCDEHYNYVGVKAQIKEKTAE